MLDSLSRRGAASSPEARRSASLATGQVVSLPLYALRISAGNRHLTLTPLSLCELDFSSMPTQACRAIAVAGTFAELPGFVFDTETTGVMATDDRVVELGAISICAGRTSDERRMRINPGRPIPPGASAIHGISDADVA